MVKFGQALAMLLAIEAGRSACGFQPPHGLVGAPSQRASACRLAAVSQLGQRRPSSSIQDAVASATAEYLQSLSSYVTTAEEQDKEEEAEMEMRRQRVKSRIIGSYKATFSLSNEAQSIGVSLCQCDGSSSNVPNRELNVDTMEFHFLQGERIDKADRLDPSAIMGRVEPGFRGLVVSSVVRGSRAWEEGVQPGDIVMSMSATLGDALWPKSTLEGFKSALSSRRLVSDTVTLEFRRVEAEQLDNKFELTLTKPIGIQIQETEDGYVQVCGFTESASKLVNYAVKVGDRVLAVDSTLGGKLWPVSTVEGVISACTSRLPGQRITLQFERPLATICEAPTLPETAEATEISTAAVDTSISTPSVPVDSELLSRCRDILRRYANDQVTEAVRAKMVDKHALSAIVADKVMCALCDASVSLDSYTLSMVMNAYLKCRQPEGALRAFEASVGFSADGSSTPITEVLEGKDGGKIVPNESALNLYTATALLQAHAYNNDISSVGRVLAALEGRSGVEHGGLESAPWPWTGTYGAIQPDTKCYNIAIAAAEKIGGPEALELAESIFSRMQVPVKGKINTRNGQPTRDVVTYNTMISALCNARWYDDAFKMFDSMKRAGLRPDKYTYTSLITACKHEGDVRELLYDMVEQNVEADVVTYNAMIKELCDERKWTQAIKLVSEMESRAISPNSRTYAYMMNALLQADKPSSCLTLFESAFADERTSSLTDNVHLYTTAITAASKVGDSERALDLVARMNAHGVKPNVKTLTALLGACLSAGQADLAVQVYQQIDKPDGYAISQGIRAMCASGDLASASTILREKARGDRSMSGKLTMASYNAVIAAALEQKDYAVAREMVSDLLSKSYIPSKSFLMSALEKLGLLKSTRQPSNMLRQEDENDNDENSKFLFLLFFIDSLNERNLPIDGPLYAVTLRLGSRMGGLPRRIATSMVEARTDMGKRLFSSGDENSGTLSTRGWEALFSKKVDDQLTQDDRLPPLPVRVASGDVRRVLQAEKTATYKNSRNTKNARKHKGRSS